MKLVPAGSRVLALVIARRANAARYGANTGRVATEDDRKTGGVHVPLDQCVTSYEGAVAQHPTTGAWFLRVRDGTELAAGDRAGVLDADDAEWEPARDAILAKIKDRLP